MWTGITREQHARKGLRLPSDLTDAEWAIFEPLMTMAAATEGSHPSNCLPKNSQGYDL
jgi:hypothetical protein